MQVANTLATLRRNRRQLNAEALGTEVAALEKTISVLRENFERENERQREEITVLRQEIRFLHNENGRLQGEINRLREPRGGGTVPAPDTVVMSGRRIRRIVVHCSAG